MLASSRRLLGLTTTGLASLIALQTVAPAQPHKTTETPTASVFDAYHIYRGNTHSHTSFTWPHGKQWTKTDCREVPRFDVDATDPSVHTWALEGNQPAPTKCPGMVIVGPAQYPSPYDRAALRLERSPGSPQPVTTS